MRRNSLSPSPARTRRAFLRGLAGLGAGLALSRPGAAGIAESFRADSLEAALAELTAGGELLDHPELRLELPDIAEDGGKVPVQVHAPAAGDIERISILVAGNPLPLISVSRVPPRGEPYVSLRIRVRESSRVIALAHGRDGRIYRAARDIAVTAGGCG